MQCRAAAVAAACFIMAGSSLHAQVASRPATKASVGPDTVMVADKVVAVVGNRPILQSQVDEEIFSEQSQQGLVLPTSPDSMQLLRKRIVSDIIDDELMVQEAQRDTTIKVTDEEVVQAVEAKAKEVRGRFTSEVDYTNELRKAGFGTPEEYRRWLADQQRRTFYRSRLLDKLKSHDRLKPISPTEREMRNYYEKNAAQLQKRPATVTFRQIVIAPRASDAAKATARALADSIVTELRKGADFATAARRFSQDPGSKDQGGDLGWQRRGHWVPEFERVEFALRPGVISDPVETPFGYHIIQVVRSQPTESQARHILIMPTITPADVDSARALAGRISQLVAAGASFDSLQQIYHDRAEEKEAASVPLAQVPPAYAAKIADSDSGTVIPAFELTGPDGRSKFAIVKITERRPEGDLSYEDMKTMIRSQLSQTLAVQRYVSRLRSANYIDVRL